VAQLLNDYTLALKYNSLTQGFVLGYNLAYLCNHHYPMVLNLNRLVTLSLREPIQVMLEPDGDGFIARSADIPLYGFGDDRMEALQALKVEIESTYRDLLVDDDFSQEWLSVKQFLKARIIDEEC
jgi:hypothetical protein